MNDLGKVIVKPTYEYLRLATYDDGQFTDDFVIFKANNKEGMLKSKGKVIGKAMPSL